MKHLLTIVAVVASVAGLLAQPLPGFHHAIDAVEPIALHGPQLRVKGWRFFCATGNVPTIGSPTLTDTATGRVIPVTWSQKDNLERLDVYDSYRGTCPKVTKTAGFETYLSPVPPPGRYRVTLRWHWDAVTTPPGANPPPPGWNVEQNTLTLDFTI